MGSQVSFDFGVAGLEILCRGRDQETAGLAGQVLEAVHVLRHVFVDAAVVGDDVDGDAGFLRQAVDLIERRNRRRVAAVGEDDDGAAVLLLAQLALGAGHGVVQRGESAGPDLLDDLFHGGAIGGQLDFPAR